MPEGDTLEKIAGALDRRLRAATVDEVHLRGSRLQALAGRSVSGVEARGKHLLIHLDDGSCLHSHLGMHGSWHRYRSGERWRKRPARASLVLRSGEEVFVCFNAREARWHPRALRLQDTAAGRLGPDLLNTATRAAAIPQRARELLPPGELLVDVLLDQRVAAGIGNVYKSEVLFVQRIGPAQRLGETDDDTLASIYDSAMALLGRNLHGGRRRTRFERGARGRLWVYRRRGAACLRCEAARIGCARSGRRQRATYWCPACQGEGAV